MNEKPPLIFFNYRFDNKIHENKLNPLHENLLFIQYIEANSKIPPSKSKLLLRGSTKVKNLKFMATFQQ